MNLGQLRTFVAVVESRSFTAAARSLSAPTSSVSRAIARLEESLKTKLFERTTRRTTLSTAGRLYYEHARRALDALDEGEAQVGELLGQPRGEVKLTIPIHLDSGFLAGRLVAFADAHPQVTLRVVPTNRRLDLRDDAFDVALRIQLEPDDPSLVVRELGAFHAWLVASPAYLKKHGKPRIPDDLRRHRCINLDGYTYALRLHGPGGVDVVEASGTIVANDMHFVRQLAEQGAGIGPLVFSPGEPTRLPSTLVRVLPDRVVEGPRLFLVTTAQTRLPLRVRLLRDFLVQAYAGRPSWQASGG